MSFSVTGCSTEFYWGEELLRTIQKWERPSLSAECSLHCLPGRSEKSCWNSSWYGLPPPSPRELFPRQNHIPLLPKPCKAGGPSVWVSALSVQRWEGRPSPGPVSWCWGGLAGSTAHLLSSVHQMQRGGGLEAEAAPQLTPPAFRSFAFFSSVGYSDHPGLRGVYLESWNSRVQCVLYPVLISYSLFTRMPIQPHAFNCGLCHLTLLRASW